MSNPTVSSPLLISDLLGVKQSSRPIIRRAVANAPDPNDHKRALWALGRVGLNVVVDKIAARLHEAVGFDVVHAFVHGLHCLHQLHAAAISTSTSPPEEEIVKIAGWDLRHVYEPAVDVYLDEVPVMILVAQLELVFNIFDLTAVVRRGQLVMLCAGHPKVTATLVIEGERLPLRTLELPLDPTIHFDPGVDLLDQTRPPTYLPGRHGYNTKASSLPRITPGYQR